MTAVGDVPEDRPVDHALHVTSASNTTMTFVDGVHGRPTKRNERKHNRTKHNCENTFDENMSDLEPFFSENAIING